MRRLSTLPPRGWLLAAAGILAVLVAGFFWLRESSLVAVNNVAITGASGPDAPRIEAALRRGLPRGTGEVTLDDNSDHAPFEEAGIPVGGIFTGLDDCYHERCDTRRNVDVGVLRTSARATQAALADLAG